MFEAQVLIGLLGILTYAFLVDAGYKMFGADHKLVLGCEWIKVGSRESVLWSRVGRAVWSGIPILLVMYGYVGQQT